MQVAENHHPDWKQAVFAPLLLLVVVVLFYWRISLTSQYTWLESPDLANQVLPWFQFQAVEWHRGSFPLWDPYLWGGQPLLAQTQPGAAYPLNWLLFLLPLREGFIRIHYLHWYFLVIHYLAALSCYWLCRDLGRSRAASLLAGIGFTLCGWFGSTDWPQMLNGAMWAPLVFLFQFRSLRGEHPLANAALSGACLGMAFLAGHHQIPIFLVLASGAVWLWRRAWRAVVVFGLLLFLVSALQTLPAYEYGRHALRWVGAADPVGWKQPVPYSIHAYFGLRPLSLLGVVVPGIFQHANPYIGMTLLSMALVAVGSLWRDFAVRVLAAVALFGLLFSLADYGWIEGLLYVSVPLVEKARNTSMAIFIFHFGVTVLSAYGIDTYRKPPWFPKVRGLAFGLAGAIFFALLIATLGLKNRPADLDKIAMAGFTAALLPFALRPRNAAWLVGGLLILEAGLSNVTSGWLPRNHPDSYLQKMRINADIARFLRDQPGPFRVDIDQQVIPYNFGDWFGIDHFGGYLASLTTNIAGAQGSPTHRKRFAIRYSIGNKPGHERQKLVFEGAGGVNVYEEPEAGPWVWTQSACDSASRVRLAGRRPGRVSLDADLACPATVVAAETWFPGWHARANGRNVPVREADGVFQAVQLPAGKHRVELWYRPASALWGAALSLVGVLAAAFAAYRSRRAV